jgi:ABC-2 type transport system permease protein
VSGPLDEAVAAPLGALSDVAAPQGEILNFLRVLLFGGAYGYRALFAWANPLVYVPIMLVQPIFQILFFAYIGRAAHLRDDTFFLVGNGIQWIMAPTLFGMLFMLDGERWTQTLGAVLATPANRVALFVGRSLPVMLNGLVVGAWGLVSGSLVLRVHATAAAAGPLAVTIAVAVFSCAGCGFVIGSLSLRYRNGIILANVISAFLLVCTGANIPTDSLPPVLRHIGYGLPLTRAIHAARELTAGASLSHVAPLLAGEAAVGAAYAVVGFFLLRYFEGLSRRDAAFDVA